MLYGARKHHYGHLRGTAWCPLSPPTQIPHPTLLLLSMAPRLSQLQLRQPLLSILRPKMFLYLVIHVTERVQEAMDYIHKKPQIGQLTQEQLIAHLIRLQDSSDIVDEFAATRSEKPKADKQRITAKRLFGNKGSATGPESRALLATR